KYQYSILLWNVEGKAALIIRNGTFLGTLYQDAYSRQYLTRFISHLSPDNSFLNRSIRDASDLLSTRRCHQNRIPENGRRVLDTWFSLMASTGFGPDHYGLLNDSVRIGLIPEQLLEDMRKFSIPHMDANLFGIAQQVTFVPEN